MSDVEGRRRNQAQPKIQLNVLLDPALKAEVTRIALARGCFESRIVRDALVMYLEAQAQGQGRP